MLHEALQPQGEILLQLDGVFDAAAARALRKRLNAVPRDAKVVVDFGQVRALHDLGVADLAAVLAQRDGPAVTLRGLCQHQHRMLRYFGVDLDALRGAHAPLGPELRATR